MHSVRGGVRDLRTASLLAVVLAGCAEATSKGNLTYDGPFGANDDGGGGGESEDLAVNRDLAMRQCIVPLEDEFCPPVIYVRPGGDDFNSGMRPDQALHPKHSHPACIRFASTE